MKTIKRYTFIFLTCFATVSLLAQQTRKLQNQPYADQKLYHVGFMVGFHSQDMTINHSGYVSPITNEAWFAEIPSYDVGLSVGIIGDRYLNEFFNLRFSPTLHFGERNYVFREQSSIKEKPISFKSNLLYMPIQFKYSAARTNNYRPYFIAGGYASMVISGEKNQALRFKNMDYGIELGVGCNYYLPLFKLCPELKFSFGLVDYINPNKSDLKDKELLKYRDAVSSGKTRMISLVFNFE